jgi:hypothetical protein
MYNRRRAHAQRNAQQSAKIQRKMAIRTLVNHTKYFLPKRFSEKALAEVVESPHIFSVPNRKEINERRLQMGFPSIGADVGPNMERAAPERRIVEGYDDIRAPEVGTFDSTVYSNKFCYEVLHLLYYLMPADMNSVNIVERGTYLPFISREPDIAWIKTMLEAYDPKDLTGVRAVFDPKAIMSSLESPDERGLNVVLRAMPGFLNIPNQGLGQFLEDLGFLAKKFPRMARNGQKPIRSCFLDLLVSLRQLTIATEETDFNLTRMYTFLIDLREEIVGVIDEFASARQRDAQPLLIHMLRYQLDRVDTLVRGILSKTMNGQDLVDVRHDEFLLRTNPKVYSALKRVIGCPQGLAEFTANGRVYNAANFIMLSFTQNAMTYAVSSTLSDSDETLRSLLEVNANQAAVIETLGLVDADGLAAFCERLSNTLGRGTKRANLFRVCASLNAGHRRILQNGIHSTKSLTRCAFILKYSAIVD